MRALFLMFAGAALTAALAPAALAVPSVEMTLAPDRAAARPGDAITWTLTVHNAGTAPFRWSDLTLVPAAGLTLDAPAPPVPNELVPGGPPVTLTGHSAAGSDACFGTVAPRVTAALATRPPQAEIADTLVTGPPVRVDCSVDVQVVAPFDRSTYTPAEAVTRTAIVNNVGQAPIPLGSINVWDTALGAYTAVPGAPAVLAPGASVAYLAARTAGVADCGTLWGTTTVTLGDASGRYVDGDPSSNTWTGSTLIAGGACSPPAQPSAPRPAAPTGTIQAAAPALTTSVAAPAKVRRGTRGLYRVQVTNRTSKRVTSLAVGISVPTHVIINQKLARRDVRTGNTVWRRKATLAPRATWTVTLKVRYPLARVGVRRALVRISARGLTTVRRVSVTRVIR